MFMSHKSVHGNPNTNIPHSTGLSLLWNYLSLYFSWKMHFAMNISLKIICWNYLHGNFYAIQKCIIMMLLNEEKSCLYTDKSAWTLVSMYAMHFKFLRNNSKQCSRIVSIRNSSVFFFHNLTNLYMIPDNGVREWCLLWSLNC